MNYLLIAASTMDCCMQTSPIINFISFVLVSVVLLMSLIAGIKVFLFVNRDTI